MMVGLGSVPDCLPSNKVQVEYHIHKDCRFN